MIYVVDDYTQCPFLHQLDYKENEGCILTDKGCGGTLLRCGYKIGTWPEECPLKKNEVVVGIKS